MKPIISVLAFLLVTTLAAWPCPVRADKAAPGRLPLVLSPPIRDLDLSDTTLEKAFDRLRTLLRVDIVVRWPALEAANVKRGSPVKMRVWDVRPDIALTMLLRYVENEQPFAFLAWDQEDGVVTVSTQDDLSPGPPKVYDVRDLLGAMADRPRATRKRDEGDGRTKADVEDELVRLIVESVLPDSWRDAGGTTGSIRSFGGRLVITQSFEGHRQVRRLLQELRQEFIGKDRKPATAPAAPPAPPPR